MTVARQMVEWLNAAGVGAVCIALMALISADVGAVWLTRAGDEATG